MSGDFFGFFDSDYQYENSHFGFCFDLSKSHHSDFEITDSNHPSFENSASDYDYLYFEISSYSHDSDIFSSPSFILSVFPVEEGIESAEEAVKDLSSDLMEDGGFHSQKIDVIEEIENLPYYEEYLVGTEYLETYWLIFQQENYFFLVSMFFDSYEAYEVLEDFISTFTFYPNDSGWDEYNL
ncbi:MAG: hypothetical protein PQJ50_11055 [Spirochaetales bacterium]|nr:hypothetical protein [Spirochaetales bacterium]